MANLLRQWLSGAGAIPNGTVSTPDTVGPAYDPGDPHGVTVVDDGVPAEGRMAAFVPSPWSGWPASWASPTWGNLGGKFDDLVDTAWAALDLNSSVLSAMPVYRTRNAQVLPPPTWMTNPDPDIYTGWPEFAKQLFWDFQMGEAFVLSMSRGADGWPYAFRVIPPWMVNVEMAGGRRQYNIGSLDVTDDILHIRYRSTTDAARGSGPLESSSAQARLVAAGVLARYAADIAQGGGIPKYVLEVEARLTGTQSRELLDQWWDSRMANMGEPFKPAVLSGGAKARPLQLSPKDMLLTELAQFTEARISNLLGVPPFLLGLPSGDSMTYSNATSLFDFHDRRYLKTAAVHVMSALSGWAVPRGQSVELNRDEYSRPALAERAKAYVDLVSVGAITAPEIRVMERLTDAPIPPSDAANGPDGFTPHNVPNGPTAADMNQFMAAQALSGGGRG